MPNIKSKINTITYELLVRVFCPHCKARDKDIGITLPARGLPDKLRCFNCDTMIEITDLFKKGQEQLRRRHKDEKVKGITL